MFQWLNTFQMNLVEVSAKEECGGKYFVNLGLNRVELGNDNAINSIIVKILVQLSLWESLSFSEKVFIITIKRMSINSIPYET